MKKTTAPFPSSLILKQRKQGDKKKNTKGQPNLNKVTYPKLKNKRELYSLKLKTNLQSKEKTGTKDLKATKEEKIKTSLTIFFYVEDEIKPSKRCCQGLAAKLPLRLVYFSLLFPQNNTRIQERKLPLFAAFFTLPFLRFLVSLYCIFSASYSPVFSFFLLSFCCPRQVIRRAYIQSKYVYIQEGFNALILRCKSLLICSKKNAKGSYNILILCWCFTFDFFPVLEEGVAIFFPSIGPPTPFEMR